MKWFIPRNTTKCILYKTYILIDALIGLKKTAISAALLN